MQDVLGVNQDATVAEERLRAWAGAVRERGAAAGLLVQRELDRKAAARALRPVVWKELRRSAKRVG